MPVSKINESNKYFDYSYYYNNDLNIVNLVNDMFNKDISFFNFKFNNEIENNNIKLN